MFSKKESRIDDIYQYECCCALLVSILSPSLCGPEVAFHKMGINTMRLPGEEQERYRSICALRELGWIWPEVGDYLGIGKDYAWKIWNKGRKGLL